MNAESSSGPPARSAVLVFVKYPRPGRVKTRLAADLGPQAAADLYRAFVQDLQDRLAGLPVPVVYYAAGGIDLKAYRHWLGPAVLLRQQRGDDLGQRMAAAFQAAFAEGHHHVLLLGSDCPDLPLTHVQAALSHLTADPSTVVIGPSLDGGYVLLGLTSTGFHADLFTDIAWSTDRVTKQTLERCRAHGRRTVCLPPWYDIDTIEDVARLARRHRGKDTGPRASLARLRELGLASIERESP